MTSPEASDPTLATAGDLAPELDANGEPVTEPPSAVEVFRNRPFLLLWLSQVFTQIGGNMVLFGLTLIVLKSGAGNTAVSLLVLSFLAPAVLFSAVAGVYVDRLDKRLVLVITNVLRAGLLVLLWLAGSNLLLLLIINLVISTVTVFFAPAEASMIPQLVPRRLLLSANGVFTLTLNAAFAIGYAVAGPVVVALVGGPGLILVVAVCYLVAAGFCWTLPPSPPAAQVRDGESHLLPETEQAMGSTFAQLREGVEFIRANRSIGWSLLYLGIAASLVGVLGVLGPRFAQDSLGLQPEAFAVVVLPLGFGIVTGILILNSFGHLVPRRAGSLGLAVHLSEGSTGSDRSAVETAVRAGDLIQLTALTAGSRWSRRRESSPTRDGSRPSIISFASTVRTAVELVDTYVTWPNRPRGVPRGDGPRCGRVPCARPAELGAESRPSRARSQAARAGSPGLVRVGAGRPAADSSSKPTVSARERRRHHDHRPRALAGGARGRGRRGGARPRPSPDARR